MSSAPTSTPRSGSLRLSFAIIGCCAARCLPRSPGGSGLNTARTPAISGIYDMAFRTPKTRASQRVGVGQRMPRMSRWLLAAAWLIAGWVFLVSSAGSVVPDEPDLDAAVTAFCERVIFDWPNVPEDDRELFRQLWRPRVADILAAASAAVRVDERQRIADAIAAQRESVRDAELIAWPGSATVEAWIRAGGVR